MGEAELSQKGLRVQRYYLGEVLLKRYGQTFPPVIKIGTQTIRLIQQDTAKRLRETDNGDVADELDKLTVDEVTEEVRKKSKTLRELVKRQNQGSSQGTLCMLSRRLTPA